MAKIFKAVSSKTGRPRKYALEAIGDLYSSGVSAVATGRLLGLHHTTVLYALKQMGIERRKRPALIADARRERAKYVKAERAARAIRNSEICDLYNKGFLATDIARRLGITRMVIYGAIKAKGLPSRPHGGPRPRLCSGPKPPLPALQDDRKFIDYAEYRREWRDARKAERMLEILSRRKDRAA